jgi:hypothetical protein
MEGALVKRKVYVPRTPLDRYILKKRLREKGVNASKVTIEWFRAEDVTQQEQADYQKTIPEPRIKWYAVFTLAQAKNYYGLNTDQEVRDHLVGNRTNDDNNKFIVGMRFTQAEYDNLSAAKKSVLYPKTVPEGSSDQTIFDIIAAPEWRGDD